MTHRIAHVSDLHFGRHDPAVVDALRADLEERGVALVVASGDLTQRARPAEFEAAARFLRSLAAPALAVPGNHDVPMRVPERWTRPFRAYRAALGPDLAPTWADPAVCAAGLNTADPWVWKGGVVRRAEMAALWRHFALAGPRLRVAFAHHPFAVRGDAGHSPVRGWRGAVAELEAAGTDILLTGHQHRLAHGESRAFDAGGPHRIIVVEAGTATSVRQRGEPNAYNVLHVDEDRIGIEQRVWRDGRFHGTHVQVYPRRRWAGAPHAAGAAPGPAPARGADRPA